MTNPTPPNTDDGWIEWSGGECPVPPETLIVVRLRSGDEIGNSHTLAAADWCKSEDFPDEPSQWEHAGWPDDIVAYRIVKPGEGK